jgi:N6-adenosine-specific RNA methylase IME4
MNLLFRRCIKPRMQRSLILNTVIFSKSLSFLIAMIYAPTDARGQQKLAILEQLVPKTTPLPIGAFSTIAIDPPWKYSLRESDETHRGRCPYPSMSDTQILDMRIGLLLAPKAYVLWATNTHLPLAFRCLSAWGLEYKTIHTWVKVPKNTSADEWRVKIATGHYGRNCTEHFLVATHGTPPAWTGLGLTDIPNVIYEPVGEHSEKPEGFYKVCDRLHAALSQKVEGDRLELFARKQRDGWTVWGTEA